MLATLQRASWLPDLLSCFSSRTNHFLRIFLVIALVGIIGNLTLLGARLNMYQRAQTLFRDSGSRLDNNSDTDNSSILNRTLAAAGNSTLGFANIQFVNLKHRFDRLDAATLQAYVSGIDIIPVSGVEAVDIHDVGMPPTHRLNALRDGEKGCWRAHANLWSQMLREKLPAILIIESDAAWDVNVREIMSNLNVHFTRFLNQRGSTPLHSAGWNSRNSPDEKPGSLGPDPDDPWHTKHWDMLSLGQCFEATLNSNHSLAYPDKHVPEGKDYFGKKMGHERVVRLSGGIVCTTAYAISQTGAAKLLLRGAVDLDNPVDLLMRRMSMSGDMTVYSVMPTIFGQWEYVDKIGMGERGANSDINGAKAEGEIDMGGWTDVKKTGSVWRDKQGHPDVAFENMALEKAWGLILQNADLTESQYHDKDGN